MSAEDDYPILVAWLAGTPMVGFDGDAMEVEVARILREVDQLRAEKATLGRYIARRYVHAVGAVADLRELADRYERQLDMTATVPGRTVHVDSHHAQ